MRFFKNRYNILTCLSLIKVSNQFPYITKINWTHASFSLNQSRPLQVYIRYCNFLNLSTIQDLTILEKVVIRYGVIQSQEN